jgi:tripartite-type tricarboxylate transporter receptor subunit TctC
VLVVIATVAVPAGVDAVNERGYEASGWSGVCAPKNIAPPVVDTLNLAINEGLRDTRVKARFADLGAMTLGGSAQDFGQLIVKDRDKWTQLIRNGNIE